MRRLVIALALVLALGPTAAANVYSHIPLGNLFYRYSLQSGEAAWIVAHNDLLIFDNNNYNYLGTLKSQPGGAACKMIWYQLWDTCGVGDTSDVAAWCTAHSVDIETMFLHYSEATTMVLGGISYSYPSYDAASPKSASRVVAYIWGSRRYVYYVGNANFQQYRAEKVYASVTTPPSGQTQVFDGVFCDEAMERKVPRSGDTGVGTQTGGAVREYAELIGSWKYATWDSQFASCQWLADWTALATAVRAYLAAHGASAKITMLNAGDGWWTLTCETAAAACYRESWLRGGIAGRNNPSALSVVTNASAASIKQILAFTGRQLPFPDEPDRLRMWALATFYLTKSDYTYFGPTYDTVAGGYGGYMPAKWFGAIGFDVGTPSGAYTTLATGTDPVGQPYKVYARAFSKALVVLRVYQNSSYQNFSASTAVTVNLGGSYREVAVDGTVSGAIVTTRSMKQGEGAILAAVVSNQAPVLGAIGTKSVLLGNTLTFTCTATDPNGDALTFSATGLPTGATLNAISGAFSWKPSLSQVGSNIVRFIVSDPGALTDYEDVTIIVAPPADNPPILDPIGNQTFTATEAASFTISATDPDGDALTYAATGLPTGATFTASTRTFAWTPTYAQAGTYAGVTFTVSDGTLADSEAITITVLPVAPPPNNPPILAGIGDKSATVGITVAFTLVATDADGDTVTYSGSNLPAGAVINATTGRFSWLPTVAATYAGVVLVASDGTATDSETITITVAAAPPVPAPILYPIGDKTAYVGRTLTFTISATVAGGGAITYSAANLPPGATFTTATFKWVPGSKQMGWWSVTFLATSAGLSDSETIRIRVKRR